MCSLLRRGEGRRERLVINPVVKGEVHQVPLVPHACIRLLAPQQWNVTKGDPLWVPFAWPLLRRGGGIECLFIKGDPRQGPLVPQ